MPFSFLSSAFVPLDTMPAALRSFADHQPLTFMVDAGRRLMIGDAVTANLDHGLAYYVTGSLLWSLALAVVFAPLAVRAYRKGYLAPLARLIGPRLSCPEVQHTF